MNPQLKTVLLTVLTLSVFVIALVELSGVSQNSLNALMHSDKSAKATPNADLSRDQRALSMPKTTIAFADMHYNFGTIKEGDIVKHAFRFKNTGANPLFISRTDVSCGCTTPSYPQDPIKPGDSSEILVQYNSAHHPGHQQKNVLVHSNAQQESISIGFEADVKEK